MLRAAHGISRISMDTLSKNRDVYRRRDLNSRFRTKLVDLAKFSEHEKGKFCPSTLTSHKHFWIDLWSEVCLGTVFII